MHAKRVTNVVTESNVEEWEKVKSLAHASWVDESIAAATGLVSSRPPSAAPSIVGLTANSASAQPSLRSLSQALIQQRLELNDITTKSGTSKRVEDVLELVLDRMALRDCGECDGATLSPLADWPQLRRVTLNFNGVERMTTAAVLAPLADLRELEIDYNKLTQFGPLANPRIESVSLCSNQLSLLRGFSCPRLHTLQLHHNRLTSSGSGLAELRLPCLTHLDLSHNLLNSLEGILEGFVKLTHLNVSHNQIASLNGVQNLSQLEELDASYNRLRYVPTLQHSNALRSLGKSLTVLDVSHNDISSLGFFPPNVLLKVWSLSIAANAFTKKKSTTTASGSSRALGGTILRGSRKTSTLATVVDDIGDATYNDDDSDIKSNASSRRGGGPPASSSSSSRPWQQQQQKSKAASSSQGSNGDRRSSTQAAAAPAHEFSLTLGGTPRVTSDDSNTTFLARLALLFPNVEALDLSDNSEDIIADVADLRYLQKCAQLTELKIKGTLEAPLCAGGRLGESIRLLLPKLEVCDGEVLLHRDAVTLDVEDLEAAGVADQKTLFQLTRRSSVGVAGEQPNRPTSAASRGGGTPGSAATLLRPGTSSQSKVNALHASKLHDELEAFRHEMEAFLVRAEVSRQKVGHIIDHMNANIAWAYGDSEAVAEPKPLNLEAIENEIEQRIAVGYESNALQIGTDGGSSSDDDDGGGSSRSSSSAAPRPMPPSSGSTRGPHPPPSPSVTSVNSSGTSSAKARPPVRSGSSSSSNATGSAVSRTAARDAASPKAKQAAQRSLRSVSAGRLNPDNGSEQTGSHVSNTSTMGSSTLRSASQSSVISRGSRGGVPSAAEPSEAMRRIKAQPTTSFHLEQARFKEEMEKEAQLRREQIERLTKDRAQAMPAPKSKRSWASSSGGPITPPTSKPQLDVQAVQSSMHLTKPVSDCGTSMVSPSRPPTTAGAGLAPERSERVTTATGTSPPTTKQNGKLRAGASSSIEPDAPVPIPRLELGRLQSSEILTVDERDECVLEGTAVKTDEVMVRQGGDPRSHTQTSRTPTSTPVVEADVLTQSLSRPSSALVVAKNGPKGAQPRVKLGRQSGAGIVNAAAAAELPSKPSNLTLDVTASDAQVRDDNRKDDEEEEVTVFFDTKPVPLFVAPTAATAKAVMGGSSLNKRRK